MPSLLLLFLCAAVPMSALYANVRPDFACTQDCRVEKDTMGEVKVSNEALWGAQTQRSLENFKIGTDAFPPDFLKAFMIQKKSCALANKKKLGDKIADAIVAAADDVLSGKGPGGSSGEAASSYLATQFPLVVYQTGSGTQTNMNVNEVLANLANEKLGATDRTAKSPVHPNDHVNKGQSTNDSFPTAMHIAVALVVVNKLRPALVNELLPALQAKAEEFKSIVKIGRTHMQDATPLTLGQEFSAWAAQVQISVERLDDALKRVYKLAQGGTAVGTGINTEEGFDVDFAANVAKFTGLPFETSPNKFEGIASHDAMAEMAGVLQTIATSFMKIANDIRLLSSGPTGGLAEIWLPANEPGSSIMPGKVNPTQAEAMSMVAAQVIGLSNAVAVSNSHGHLDLNAFKPIIVFNVLKSVELLTDTASSFTSNCVVGIKPNLPKIQEHLSRNLMLVTALNPLIGGYEKAADVAKTALKENKTLKQVAVDEKKYLSSEDFDKYVVPANMVTPAKKKKE